MNYPHFIWLFLQMYGAYQFGFHLIIIRCALKSLTKESLELKYIFLLHVSFVF